MTRIDLPNGKVEYINENKSEDYVQLIEENVGKEVAYFASKYIQRLTNEADYTRQKINTDLDSYESSLESWNTAATDILELCQKINIYLRDSKRIDRYKIMDLVNEINKTINNEM